MKQEMKKESCVVTNPNPANTYDRMASVPQDLAIGLVYENGTDSAPTDLMLQVGGSGFPGVFCIYLAPDEIRKLGEALRARGPALIVGIEVTQRLPVSFEPRPGVLALYFPRGFRGMLAMMIDYDSADRLAFQCESMLREFETRQDQP